MEGGDSLKRIAGWFKRNLRKCVVVTGVLFLSSIVVYGAMKRISNKVEDSFQAAASVNPLIQETFVDFSDTEKENVKINAGNTSYPVYVRAAIVISWQNSSGQIYGNPPEEGVDYTLEINETKWEYNSEDHYYYYVDPVSPNEDTAVLIKSCEELLDSQKSGYTLSVDVIAQTIQAVGSKDDDSKSAMREAWGVSE